MPAPSQGSVSCAPLHGLHRVSEAIQSNPVAFVFPGQGSQSVGMLAELAELHPCP